MNAMVSFNSLVALALGAIVVTVGCTVSYGAGSIGQRGWRADMGLAVALLGLLLTWIAVQR